MRAHQPIGVFDSGIGGLSILRALRAELPCEDFVYLADTGFAPYGERGDDFVIGRTRAIAQQLREQHAVKALVIACNTATAAAIHLIRAEMPALPLVGVEPALKPAVTLSKTRCIGVMATRGTVNSAKFRALRDSLKDQAEFILQPCDGLADAIQNGDAAQTRALCGRYAAAIGPFGTETGQVDTLVLGCTHYAFASSELQALVGPGVRLIETGEPVARQTRRLLDSSSLLRENGVPGRLTLVASGDQPALEAAATRLLGV